MSGFLDLAARRYSVRAYRPDPVSDADLDAVLEAARLAPTACNLQPFRLIVVRDPNRRAFVCRAYPRDWLKTAPVIVVLCVEPAAAWKRRDGKDYADVDGAIVMDHLILAAAERGLGTCWIGAFNPSFLREALSLPEGIEPLAMTPIGHPADQPGPKKRKALADLVRQEHW